MGINNMSLKLSLILTTWLLSLIKCNARAGSELTIGMFGLYPNFLKDQDDAIKGSDSKMIKTLAEKMHFKYNIQIGNSFDGIVNKVGSYHLISIFRLQIFVGFRPLMAH